MSYNFINSLLSFFIFFIDNIKLLKFSTPQSHGKRFLCLESYFLQILSQNLKGQTCLIFSKKGQLVETKTNFRFFFSIIYLFEVAIRKKDKLVLVLILIFFLLLISKLVIIVFFDLFCVGEWRPQEKMFFSDTSLFIQFFLKPPVTCLDSPKLLSFGKKCF